MLTGAVIGYRKEKRYGYITSGKKSFFLHENHMQKGEEIPDNGDVVEFEPQPVKTMNPLDKDLAVNVRILHRATR